MSKGEGAVSSCFATCYRIKTLLPPDAAKSAAEVNRKQTPLLFAGASQLVEKSGCTLRSNRVSRQAETSPLLEDSFLYLLLE